MKEDFVKVTCTGQVFYVRDRNKNFKHYEVDVQLPTEHLDKALWYIKKHLIMEALFDKFPDLGVTGVRTCAISSNLPVPIMEEEEEGEFIDSEGDVFNDADTMVSEDFGDIEEVIGKGEVVKRGK